MSTHLNNGVESGLHFFLLKFATCLANSLIIFSLTLELVWIRDILSFKFSLLLYVILFYVSKIEVFPHSNLYRLCLFHV